MRNIILHQRKERDRIVCGVRDLWRRSTDAGRRDEDKSERSPWK